MKIIKRIDDYLNEVKIPLSKLGAAGSYVSIMLKTIAEVLKKEASKEGFITGRTKTNDPFNSSVGAKDENWQLQFWIAHEQTGEIFTLDVIASVSAGYFSYNGEKSFKTIIDNAFFKGDTFDPSGASTNPRLIGIAKRAVASLVAQRKIAEKKSGKRTPM